MATLSGWTVSHQNDHENVDSVVCLDIPRRSAPTVGHKCEPQTIIMYNYILVVENE